MKTTRPAHFAHPWRVHTLAADFELLDMWRFEVRLYARREHGRETCTAASASTIRPA